MCWPISVAGVPLAELRDKCEISRDGSTAAGIKRAAEHYGLECGGWHGEVDKLKKLPLPLILFWEYNHFLILEGFDHEWFYLNDPATGRRKLSVKDFNEGFTGIALQFKLGPEFQRGGVRPNILQRIPAWLHGTRGGLAYVIACGLMLTVLALVTPALLAIFVDRVLGEGEPWGRLVAGALAVAAVLVYGLAWLKQRCLRHLAVRVSIIAWNHCLTRLLRLPVDYFSHRLAGELTARVLSVDKIANGLSKHLIDLLIEIGMSVVFLGVMLAYAPMLALIVLGLAVLNAVLMRMISRIRSDANHALRREQGLLLGVGTMMLHHTDTLRMTASDDRFFSRWSGHQARELAARQRFSELSHINAAMPGLFTVLGSVAVLILGATQVMAGEMTLGTLMGFYIVAAMFLAPVGRFVAFADDFQALETDMQRLEDITKAPEDPELMRRSQESRTIANLERAVATGWPRGTAQCYFWLQPGQATANQRFQPGDQAGATGRSGWSERFREVDDFALGIWSLSALVWRNFVRWPPAA